MALVDQWDELQKSLGDDWADARLRLTLADETEARRAVALLGPVAPARAGDAVLLYAVRRGAGVGPAALGRALARLDRDGIAGRLELAGSTAAAPAPEPQAPPTLAAAWDDLLATLPPDWSDLYVEVGLRSSDYIPRASLRMTPLNARRTESGPPALRFRVAREAGYGAAPSMTRRCLERCDEDAILGSVRLLRVLSSTDLVGTQGPVWHIAGRTV